VQQAARGHARSRRQDYRISRDSALAAGRRAQPRGAHPPAVFALIRSPAAKGFFLVDPVLVAGHASLAGAPGERRGDGRLPPPAGRRDDMNAQARDQLRRTGSILAGIALLGLALAGGCAGLPPVGTHDQAVSVATTDVYVPHFSTAVPPGLQMQ